VPSVSRRYSAVILLLATIFAALVAADVGAHTLRPAVATLELDASGSLSVQIRANAEAILADIGPDQMDTDDSPNVDYYNTLRALPADELAEVFAAFVPEFLSALQVKSDLGNVPLEFRQIVVPEPGDLDLSRDSMIELRGSVPLSAQNIVWTWPQVYGSSVVRLSTPGSEVPATTWLQAGQPSDALQISGLIEPPTTFTVVSDYIVLGFEHILPLGLDHILFVLGLFLLSIKLRPLLWQVSAFTLAHTLTLGLSVYGLISLPTSIVEPLIALSIAYVGLENCLSSELKPWRVVLVFAFGLLHGLGFAGVLSEIGLPEGEFLTALISFNVGVEFGQLAVIGSALFAVGWFRQRNWYRSVVVIPGSLLIAAAGLYWTWERVLG
jgi:hydrogenase/urease accessory protein HupE